MCYISQTNIDKNITNDKLKQQERRVKPQRIPPNPALLIISLEICQTRVILFLAHPLVVNYHCEVSSL